MFDIQKCLEENGAYIDIDLLESRIFLSKIKSTYDLCKSSYSCVELSNIDFSSSGLISNIISRIDSVGKLYFDNLTFDNFDGVVCDRGFNWTYPGEDFRVLTIIMPSQRKSSVNIKTRNAIFAEDGSIIDYCNENSFTATEDKAVVIISNLFGLELFIEESDSFVQLIVK